MMRFFEAKSGIWIPEGTDFASHAPKTRNYSLLADISVPGVSTLDALISIPPLDSNLSLSDRVAFIEEVIATLSSHPKIHFNKNDYLIRSALTFEDTVETRAAGIGNSIRCTINESLQEKRRMLEVLLDYEHHLDILAYTKKHNISYFGLGLQLCSTIVNEEKYRVDASGSAKLLADDFVEIIVNKGHSFEGLENKIPNARYYFKKNAGTWKCLFKRKDDYVTDYNLDKIIDILTEPLLATLDTLKSRKDFPEGVEIEYVKETETSPLVLVQYAPIPFFPKEDFKKASFSYRNKEPKYLKQCIIGISERYFSRENIFLLEKQKSREEEKQIYAILEKFNASHPNGYLLIDVRQSEFGVSIPPLQYHTISNVSAILHPEPHVNNLSDHGCQVAREQGILVAIPYHWTKIISNEDVFKFPADNNRLDGGISLRVHERTQECFIAYGNVWKR